jgi:hypothetical protein
MRVTIATFPFCLHESFAQSREVVKSLFSESIKTFVVKFVQLYVAVSGRERNETAILPSTRAAREMISRSPYNLLRSATIFFLSSSSPPSRLVLLSATEKNLNEKIKTRALRLCGCFEIEIPTEKCVFFSMSHHPFPALMPELNMFLMISDNFSPLLSSSKFSYFFSCLINNRVSFCLLDDWKWIFNGVTPRNLIAQSARADSAGNGKRKIRRWRNFLLEFWGECHDNVTSLVEASLKPD